MGETVLGIDAVEAKEVERINGGERDVGAGGDHERVMQIVRQRRAQVDRFSRHRMTKDQPRRV